MKKQNNQANLTQEQIWDEIASKWNEFKRVQYEDYKEFIKGKKGKILDIGCGSGRNFVKNKDLQFYGIDFSEEMLKLAEKKKIAVELKKANAEKIPYEDDFFDAAVYLSTLHCLESKEKRQKSLEELKRVLKLGKEALISVWSRNNKRVKNKPKESFIPWTIKHKKLYRYYYIYEKEELAELLEKVGFEVVKIWENDNIVVIVRKPEQ